MARRSTAACARIPCALRVENSLKRLGVDCIDLYQTHWPSAPPDFTPIADTMAALLAFKDQGKIRAMGVCNVSVAELKRTSAAARW